MFLVVLCQYIENKVKEELTIFTKLDVDIENMIMYVSHVCGKVCCVYPAVFISDHFTHILGHDEKLVLYC